MVIKIIQSLLYYIALIIGLLGLLLLSFKNKTNLVLIAIPIYLIAVYPILFRYTESRYFMPFYYFAIVGCIYIVKYVFEKVKFFSDFIDKQNI